MTATSGLPRYLCHGEGRSKRAGLRAGAAAWRWPPGHRRGKGSATRTRSLSSCRPQATDRQPHSAGSREAGREGGGPGQGVTARPPRAERSGAGRGGAGREAGRPPPRGGAGRLPPFWGAGSPGGGETREGRSEAGSGRAGAGRAGRAWSLLRHRGASPLSRPRDAPTSLGGRGGPARGEAASPRLLGDRLAAWGGGGWGGGGGSGPRRRRRLFSPVAAGLAMGGPCWETSLGAGGPGRPGVGGALRLEGCAGAARGGLACAPWVWKRIMAVSSKLFEEDWEMSGLNVKKKKKAFCWQQP